MQNVIGNWLIAAGIALVIFGLIAKSGIFAWFGHLPLDIHVKREGFQFFLPLGSMLVVSVVLSIVLSLIRKLF